MPVTYFRQLNQHWQVPGGPSSFKYHTLCEKKKLQNMKTLLSLDCWMKSFRKNFHEQLPICNFLVF